MGACRPNAAHLAIARLTLRNADARLVTQNVDGLHELALEEAVSEGNFPGDSAARAAPIRLHGSLFRTRCTGCDDRDLGSPSCRSQERGFLTTVRKVRGTATAGRRLVWRGPRSRDPATGDGKGGESRSLPGRGYERAGTPRGLAAPPDKRVRGRGCGGESRVYSADGNRRVEHSRPGRADPAEAAHSRAGTEWLTSVFIRMHRYRLPPSPVSAVNPGQPAITPTHRGLGLPRPVDR